MKDKKEELLTPVGRLVRGSLYHGSNVGVDNQPLVYKSGPNAGQPRTDFYFAVAFKKGLEKHWAETEWGKLIWQIGHAAFPNGQGSSPSFAWKITDGDSNIPNRNGNKPCDNEGYPGHWVINFSSSFAPTVVNEDGTKQIIEVDFVKLGDFVQVYGSVAGNESQQQPGVFINPVYVAFSRYGQRIIAGVDAKNVGFGKSPIPAGASPTPLDSRFNPAAPSSSATPPPVAPVPSPVPAPVAAPVAAPAPAPVTPHYDILTPPAPPSAAAAPKFVLTEKAGGATYEQMIAVGWSHDLLVQHGYLIA